jgi:alkylation response protein AidB-like acyl-CoA dehydrogenase
MTTRRGGECPRELGWAGIAIEERHGGSGLGMVELSILQHERAAVSSHRRSLRTVCLAAPLIAELGSERSVSNGCVASRAATHGSRSVSQAKPAAPALMP